MARHSKSRSLTLPFGLGQASFWMSVCITLSFAAVHLKALGFSNTELGLVMAAGNILGALLGPLLTSLAETRPGLRTAGLIWPLFALRGLFLGGLLFCAERSYLSAALYALYLAVTMAVNSLNLKYCVDAEQRGMALDYGKARAAGSLAFVLISALLGLLVKRWSYLALIWAGFAVLLLQAAANALLRVEYQYFFDNPKSIIYTICSFLFLPIQKLSGFISLCMIFLL